MICHIKRTGSRRWTVSHESKPLARIFAVRGVPRARLCRALNRDEMTHILATLRLLQEDPGAI